MKEKCSRCSGKMISGHRRSYQKKPAKISRQKLKTIRKKKGDKEDTGIAIPPPDTPRDRIKRIMAEIVRYEAEKDKKKEEIVELLHSIRDSVDEWRKIVKKKLLEAHKIKTKGGPV